MNTVTINADWWSDRPVWARYTALDHNGTRWIYEHKPSWMPWGWQARGRAEQIPTVISNPAETLEERK
jgi:hypothetical protein